MPESMPFLLKQGRHDELKSIVARLRAELQSASRPITSRCPHEDKADNAPIRHLFHEGRGFSTVMFWIAFFMCLFMVYALSSWLTKLMASAGYSLGSALTFVLVLNFGAMIGAVGGGWLADRFHIKWVLFSMYVLAAVSITLLGYKMSTEVLFIVVGLAGASTIGTQIVTYAYVGPVLPDGNPLHRHRLGVGRRPQRRDPGADRDRHAGGHGRCRCSRTSWRSRFPR